MRGWLVCVLAACGGGSAPPSQPTGPAATLIAPASGTDDVIVAQVNGRPVWGSCVAAQASRGIARDAALRECVDFELLAQAAEARGLATAPEVTAATRRALASRLVETGFEATYRSPADVPGQIDRVIAANPLLANRPERRGSTYVRFETCGRSTCIKCRPGDQIEPECKGVEKPPSPELDAEARRLADQVFAELGTQSGLFPQNLVETAERVAKGAGGSGGRTAPQPRLAHDDFKAEMRSGIVQPYRDALFGIPEVGKLAAPVRSMWGWDVILWTENQPPKMYTREEAAGEIFPELRRRLFVRWVDQVAQTLGVRVEKHYELLEEPGS